MSESEDCLAKKPVCLIMLGMAGSGKTSFVQVKEEIKFKFITFLYQIN